MSRTAAVGMVASALILGAVVVLVELSLQHVTSRRGLAVAIGVPVVVMVALVALAWLGVGRRTAPPSLPAIIAGPPAVAIALVPLAVIIALGIASSGREGIGPLSATALLWGIMVPIAALYPGVAAYIAPRSPAEMAVTAISVVAPAMVIAIPLLMEPVTARCFGCQPDLWHELTARASLPAFVLVATFLAIEVASAVMRQPGRQWVVAGVVLGAVTYGTGGLLSLFAWNVFV